MPTRIQRKRTKGWRKPEGTIICDRTSRYGNPFLIINHLVVQAPDTGAVWSCGSPDRARQQASDLFYAWLAGAGPDVYRVNDREFDRIRILDDLHFGRLTGRDLACTCPLPAPGQPDHCHAAVLLRLANPDA